MFYQKYLSNIKLSGAVKEMEPNKAYYLQNQINSVTPVKVTGENGSYELVNGQQVIYNPLIKAKIDGDIDVYPIENLLSDGQIVSKIQVEFSEDNTDFLSNNAIFINADMIKGYKQTNNENTNNIYSFETIDDVATKIRYLGIIPSSLSEDEFIILNYYTTD